jgi:two-component system sensor histidine kinase DegS
MTVGVTNPREALIAEVRGEYDRTTGRLREMQSLIEQSQAEVKRLQTRSIDINTQLKRVEDNIDTVPRADIKTVYTTALDTKTRLLTMQGQLEKIQQDRSQLEAFSGTLKHILDQLEGVGALPSPSGGRQPRATGPLSGTTVVRIVEAQEAERQRLARQMHDGPAQSLTNFILQAEICQRLFDRNPDRALEELGNLKTAASTTFQKVRDFIFDLRPMMLDDLGLAPTIRRYTEAFGGKSNIEVHLNIMGEERRRIEPHAEVTMFRGVQELLGYSRDIANANKIEIVLDIAGPEVRMEMVFNGKPIEETEATIEGSNNTSKVFSLSTLVERIELVGGTMEISGTEGDSNRVQITLPAHDR